MFADTVAESIVCITDCLKTMSAPTSLRPEHQGNRFALMFEEAGQPFGLSDLHD